MITPEEKREYDEARENPHEGDPLIDFRSDEEKEAAEQGRRDGLTDEVIKESKDSEGDDD
ncbi:MAG TPA: hypothetical protein VFE53_07380 [Mucilaginibacter sp.]|jgi:hypothetical protein|nr:hypothetical protein [Mucilaginibacter sp.]